MKMLKYWCVALMCCLQLPGLSPHHGELVNSSSITDLCDQLKTTTLDAEVLFAEYSSRAAECLRTFLARSHDLGDAVIAKIDKEILTSAPSNCRTRLARRLHHVRHQAHVEAEYNAENHQKYFLAHMIVHRMHLNKTSLFVRRAEGGLRTCASSCSSPVMQNKLFRWQRTAQHELHRATDDIQHSRLAYRDLLTHAGKRLARIERKAVRLVEAAVNDLYKCANRV